MSTDPALIKFPPTKKLPEKFDFKPGGAGVEVGDGQSFITKDEEMQARSLIDELFTEITGGPLTFRPCGYLVAVKIYVKPSEIRTITRDDGTTGTLYRPDLSRDDDKYQSVAALVVAVGPDAYQGLRADGSLRYPSGPWCKVGDWVVIPRYESFAFSFKGVAMAQLPDDRIMDVIEDPADIESINQASRL